SDADVMHKLTTALSIVGLMVIGAMVATNVGLTTPIAFDINGTMFSLQETFDSIFPRLLPVCALGALYALNKKGVPVLTQIIGIMVIGVVAGLLGIFG
ncbi:MAG: PTS system mannose/fructose/sorbose family transporter subunit IID, partial [Atopobiaceae bacterium]|nr:PTS system mannose/fructose/sorbose family transporter subunit IID [Atopobiaceae bacterium]